MTKIRLTLLLVAIGIAVPAALLAREALQALHAEYRARHVVVSERAFDEMERTLSVFLAAEEARAFDAYRFSSQEGWSPERDREIAAAPEHPFVLGYFQLDPDGRLHVPWAETEGEASAGGATQRTQPELARRRSGLRQLEKLLKGRPASVQAQLVGEARIAYSLDDDLGDAKKEVKALPAPTPAVEQERKAPTKDDDARGVYEVLGRLNRAAEERSDRKQKIASAPRSRLGQASEFAQRASPSDSFASSSGRAAEEAEASAELIARAEGSPAADSIEGESDAGSRGALASRVERDDARQRARRASAALAAGPAPQRGGGPSSTVEILVDPMRGLPLAPDASELLLYRRVSADGLETLQGLIVDRVALAGWLEAEVLGRAELAGLARASFVTETTGDAPYGEALRFRHRFAEPFDDLRIELALQPLEGGSGVATLVFVCALLAGVAGLGLLAVDRTVSVAMDFSERRSNFVAAVSHELKTPLTAIRMYAEMLRDGLVPSEAKRKEYYGTITDESERLSRLINNVLEFSRLEKGNREISLSVGDIRPVVEETADRLRPHLEREGFALRLELEPELPPVRFDRDALLQMLFNLIDNSMKYSGEASPREILVSARAAEGGVSLSVRDFGPGVPRAQLERIFEPFYRAQDERTRSAQGTGIGLALVRDLADAMGARVRGENAEGGGLRVEVSLPLKAA